MAVGRRGAITGLGLEAAGVATDGGFVRVDDRLATTAPGIWAAGDVTGMSRYGPTNGAAWAAPDGYLETCPDPG